ncbi:hypothetical protein [Nitrosococcus wardiae]|uniref:Uncharacterized protein n=1 Tax=Nitrosococcus wardiae TaxID=1814290 RepID=A0A4P7C1N4_9GAMM|nr:hypothetical protein [Nitrosococcus wardiae]QBQ55530.1 hypothetical protein E3U44_14190 [Nitrosococcus wardiae]
MARAQENKEAKYSRPFDVHRWSDYPEVNKAVEAIRRELVATNPIKKVTDKQKKHLKVVILDLYVAWLSDPELWIGYSRDHHDYQVDSRYNKLHIGYRALIQVIDSLADSGYIEHKKGFNDRRTGIGFQSRMRAKKKLINLIKDRYNIRQYMTKRTNTEEVILLKDSEGNLIDYQDNDNTMRMRIQLEAINQRLERSLIDLDISDSELKELVKRFRKDPDRGTLDFSRKRLRRVFNNGSFEEGGRFYHGWWQEIPREYRKFITINDSKTVELDYGGMHLRMLYGIEGLEPPKDSYDIGIPEAPRDIIKKITNTLLNAESLQSAKGAIRKDYPDIDYAILLEKIFQKHEAIKRYFHTGIGIKLQYWDSVIAEKVMLYMYGHYDSPTLPVHDSFIVKSGSEARLQKCMEIIFNELYPTIEAQIKRSIQLMKEDTFIDKGDYQVRASSISRIDLNENPEAAARRNMLIEQIESQEDWKWKPEIHTKWSEEDTEQQIAYKPGKRGS